MRSAAKAASSCTQRRRYQASVRERKAAAGGTISEGDGPSLGQNLNNGTGLERNVSMNTTVLTDRPVQETGYYWCEACDKEEIGAGVYLVAGDRAPSCMRHRTVAFLSLR